MPAYHEPQHSDSLYDLWAKRNVHFETALEDSLIRRIADYGNGANSYNSAKGFTLGAGYEAYILAFFMGLYANKRRPLEGGRKTFGQPLQYWGNLEKRGERKPYPKLRRYMFAACLARTDINLLALERGDLPVSSAIAEMIATMDEYANYGFHHLLDKLEDDPHFFAGNSSFLSLFLPLFKALAPQRADSDADGADMPDPLD